MRRVLALITIFALTTLAFFSGCTGDGGLDPKNPVTVTMWHNYGGQMQETMDVLVDEFNSTAGLDRGIIISVTSVASQKEQAEKLTMIANGDPGAPELPDITTCYPATAVTLMDKGLLAPLDGLFTKDELDAYLPQFVDEGRLADGKLYVFPMAKSSEVLFVNQTLFDRFAADTGVKLESLATFEGIAAAAVSYCEWTDAQTPDIPGDGRTFFTADSWLNIALVGSAQLGGSFAAPGGLSKDTDTYKRIWDFCALPAISGGFAVYDGYSSDLSRTGEIVCSIGSTAGILFYGDSITYPDNTVEKVEFSVLPYPVFEGGRSFAMQRGGGMCIAETDDKTEHAAAIFIKWLTAPEQNMRFVSQTGYLPVTKKAFEESMTREIETVENASVKKLLTAAMEMYSDCTFMTVPSFEGFDAMGKQYETALKEALREARAQYTAGEKSAEEVSGDTLRQFMAG